MLAASRYGSQGIKNLPVRLLLHPVVAVHHFKKEPCCIFYACVDSRAMTAICLVNHLYDTGILCLIFIRNLCGIILCGTVVHYQYLNVFAAGKQRFNAFAHIGCRVVARYCYG